MRTSYEAVPNDSRYVPFTQQSYCCVPTSIQMIMYRHGIPLIPAEEIGYHLGLTVRHKTVIYFIMFGFRTRLHQPDTVLKIYNPAYEPNKAFRRLDIPLEFSQKLAA